MNFETMIPVKEDKPKNVLPRLVLSVALASTIACGHHMQCSGAETQKGESKVNRTELPKMTQPSPSSISYSECEQITLGDLRDVGLTIMQIKQQAINIFLEVTRKEVPKSARPELVNVDKISLTDIKPNATYLPTRPEWLTFYVGAMEPVIRLLGADVTDVRGGVAKLLVPKGNREKFELLYEEHERDVGKLNQHLTKIFEGIGDQHNNVALAKEAVYMFEVAQAMERNRVEAFHMIQGARDAELEELPMRKTK